MLKSGLRLKSTHRQISFTIKALFQPTVFAPIEPYSAVSNVHMLLSPSTISPDYSILANLGPKSLFNSFSVMSEVAL